VAKLLVENLPLSITDDTVRSLFAAHGVVKAVSLIADHESGRPRGFAYVEMSYADATRARLALNGATLRGRVLRIEQARDRKGARIPPDRRPGAPPASAVVVIRPGKFQG
jgi:RNA recognition motif-containing protein